MMTRIQRDALNAKFAVLAYKSREFLNNPVNLPAGWVLADFVENGPFAASAFKNTATGEVVVAYRGTDGVKDLGADAAILLGNWHPQFQQGLDFAKRIQDSIQLFPGGPQSANGQISVTGHSLGGALAQVAAQLFGFDGTTIDPGAGGRIAGTAEFRAAAVAFGLPEAGLGAASTFSNHVVIGSIISNSTGAHIGGVSFLPSVPISGTAAVTSALLSMLNPAAAFVYAVGTDQVANRQSSSQVSQALNLLAGADPTPGAGASTLVLQSKVLGYEVDPANPDQQRPVYSQTEFEIRSTAGELISRVRFGGTTDNRSVEVFDAVTDKLVTRASVQSDTLEIKVERADGGSSVITPKAVSQTNSDIFVSVVETDEQDEIDSASSVETDDEGNTLTHTRFADGTEITEAKDDTDQLISRVTDTPALDGSGQPTGTTNRVFETQVKGVLVNVTQTASAGEVAAHTADPATPIDWATTGVRVGSVTYPAGSFEADAWGAILDAATPAYDAAAIAQADEAAIALLLAQSNTPDVNSPGAQEALEVLVGASGWVGGGGSEPNGSPAGAEGYLPSANAGANGQPFDPGSLLLDGGTAKQLNTGISLMRALKTGSPSAFGRWVFDTAATGRTDLFGQASIGLGGVDAIRNLRSALKRGDAGDAVGAGASLYLAGLKFQACKGEANRYYKNSSKQCGGCWTNGQKRPKNGCEVANARLHRPVSQTTDEAGQVLRALTRKPMGFLLQLETQNSSTQANGRALL